MEIVDFFRDFQNRQGFSKLRKKYANKSKAQLGQDLFVLRELSWKKSGFFVEFGATNGVDLSNTYFLEKAFDWTGILAEPCRSNHDALQSNRTATIDTKCVWSKSNEELAFTEFSNKELSTISSLKDSDHMARKRVGGEEYSVSTISLNDLLKVHNAPQKIDYLSIDTEGSEFEILQAFDFSAYEISIVTVEHNFTSQRKDIYQLLTSKGYKRVLKRLSKWDDWYVLECPADP